MPIETRTDLFPNKSRFPAWACLLGISVALAGCGIKPKLYEGVQPATVGDLTPQNLSLRQVPPPSHRQIVAVYDFPDETGQYKGGDTVQTLSRAVPQAGAPLLIKALQDAGQGRWFSVLDRSKLQKVVQERQVVQSMRAQYRGENPVNPKVLGPLMHAGIILTGGIVGYDTNLETGGYGARYLGIGANTQWKYDVVTVNLRAISSETDEVLANVLVRKPIASVKGQGDIFRYVELDKLLESEAGYATNEPREIAVQQAIEKAVMALIAQGAARGIWHFKSHAAQVAFIANYRKQLFNGKVPAYAMHVAKPLTQHADDIPQTIPLAQAQVRPTPTPSAPPPPPAGANEQPLG